MATNIKSILKLEVPLSVQIASRRMSMREVANLSPGAIIELPKLADEELEIVVSNRQIGVGTAVKVGENFGVRVSHIGNLNERIQALAGKGGPVTPHSDGQADATEKAPADSASEKTEPAGTAPKTEE